MAIDPKTYDKLIKYCSYRDRAISEVKTKMIQLMVPFDQTDEYLSELQADDFINEGRYAISFAQGKSRIKLWGRQKIRLHLRHKGINNPEIQRAFESLDQEEYLSRLRELAHLKLAKVKGKNDYEKKSKVFRYLQQKGYESDLIHSILFQ